MTRDIYRRKRAGEKFVPSAPEFNLFIETAELAQKLQRIVGGTGRHGHNPDTITILNDSGSDWTNKRPIVEIETPIFDPSETDNLEILRRPAFRGGAWATEWSTNNRYNFAVCQAPVRDGDLHEGAVVSGLTWVEVQVDNANDTTYHRYVIPDDTTQMVLCGAGTGEIKWIDGGTGLKWALINIGPFAAPTYLGKTTTTHNKGATEAVSMYVPATHGLIANYPQGSETDSGIDLQVYNRYADLGSDLWVEIQWRRSGWELINAEC